MLNVSYLKIAQTFGGQRLKGRRWEIKKRGKMWDWRGVPRIEMFRHQTMVHYIKHEPTHDVGGLQEGSQSRNEKTDIPGWRRSLEEMTLKVWKMNHGWTTCAKYSDSKKELQDHCILCRTFSSWRACGFLFRIQHSCQDFLITHILFSRCFISQF